MRKIVTLFVFVLILKCAFAQKEQVALDENNKYIYYKVVEAPQINADTLYNRLLSGLRKYDLPKKVKLTTVNSKVIKGKSILILYNNLSSVKHEEGEMAYTLNIEFKNGKYRYWLTDFVFTPYQRNRYNEYEKVPGIDLPLEQLKKKYDAHTLDNYLDQVSKFGQQLGENTQKYAFTSPQKAKVTDKIDTRKW